MAFIIQVQTCLEKQKEKIDGGFRIAIAEVNFIK